MRVTIAQVNPIVGDIAGNRDRVAGVCQRCATDKPDLIIFPELYLSGYPPKDLLEREWFIAGVQRAIGELRLLSAQHPETGIILGAPLPTRARNGKGLHNAAILLYRGEQVATVRKALLPTYDVFDEARYFDPETDVHVVPFKGEILGLHICEDAWTDPSLWTRRSLYDCDPVAALAAQGATLFINISSSPFNVGKERVRYRVVSEHARRHSVPFVYVNQVGGNDELVFDGRSMAVDAHGDAMALLPSFREEIATIDTARRGQAKAFAPEDEIGTVYHALVLGLHDYMFKCGFSRAVIGLSGGIDSSLTCALAVEALGRGNVLGISMPSPYSSRGSIEDSRQLAENLGIEFRIVPITDIYRSYLGSLRDHFAGAAPNEAEENIQARIRGNILMAMSNKFGYLVLSTGNKSELAVGYCTLYGDMSGGLAVISDVPKTMVYEVSRYVNRDREIIPQACFDKPPSAELKPNQTDQDTLPPYAVLDEILRRYVEEGLSVAEIVACGFDEATARWVARAVDRNEYKRNQAAPGLRVTSKAFGIGRRMPIAARFPS
jgi:NAD+ synthase (glutamine-hydrolysing)